MSDAHDDKVDAVLFKREDYTGSGLPIGPVWVRREGKTRPYEVDHRDGQPHWSTLGSAKRAAKELGLPFFEL